MRSVPSIVYRPWPRQSAAARNRIAVPAFPTKRSAFFTGHFLCTPRTSNLDAASSELLRWLQGAEPEVRLDVANSAWLRQEFPFNPAYVKRLEDLQGIANSFSGVERSFAVQAGREVRILVRPEEIDDLASMRLARDIVKKIEESMTYPGQIKVTVIRETRAVEYAK